MSTIDVALLRVCVGYVSVANPHGVRVYSNSKNTNITFDPERVDPKNIRKTVRRELSFVENIIVDRLTNIVRKMP